MVEGHAPGRKWNEFAPICVYNVQILPRIRKTKSVGVREAQVKGAPSKSGCWQFKGLTRVHSRRVDSRNPYCLRRNWLVQSAVPSFSRAIYLFCEPYNSGMARLNPLKVEVQNYDAGAGFTSVCVEQHVWPTRS